MAKKAAKQPKTDDAQADTQNKAAPTARLEFYKTIPALAAYIDRIGAVQLNFRKYMVQIKREKYHEERAMIRLGQNGVISCNNAEYEPTEDEAKAIKEALKDLPWPESVAFTPAEAAGLPAIITERTKRKPKPADLFYFYEQNRKRIIMVQERWIDEQLNKRFFAWSRYQSRGKRATWEMMEPDGALPLWKPHSDYKRSARTKIMVHEGAKAAQYVDWLVNSEDDDAAKQRAKHPWSEELGYWEHWGMIGGALTPHRTDYEELHKAAPLEVCYVADNDLPGVSAIRTVSRMWGKKMKVVEFTDAFPPSFDLADPLWPTEKHKLTKLYDAETNKWIGSKLTDMMKPATWATEPWFNPETKRVSYMLKRIFIEDWWHVVSPAFFVSKMRPDILYTAEAFNSMMAPYSDVKDLDQKVIQMKENKVDEVQYNPSLPAGIYDERGVRFLNVHVPGSIMPMEGDATPWLEYLEHLIPSADDRNALMRWLATLIACPQTHMKYGILLISTTQGVGKSTLAEHILTPILGKRNVSHVEEQTMVNGAFNGWRAEKRLIVCHEIYAGDNKTAYTRLKSAITDETIEVNKKFQPTYTLRNWAHIMAFSNDKRALRLDKGDRRWLVPKVNNEKKPAAWWQKFHRWLRADGLGIIVAWAAAYVAGHSSVLDGEEAPMTSAKHELVEANYSEGMIRLAGLAKAMKEKAAETGNEQLFTTDRLIQEWLKDVVYEGRPTSHLERPETIRNVFTEQGWSESNWDCWVADWGYRTKRARVLAIRAEIAEEKPITLANRGLKPSNPKEMFPAEF